MHIINAPLYVTPQYLNELFLSTATRLVQLHHPCMFKSLILPRITLKHMTEAP